MKLYALAVLSALQLGASAANLNTPRHNAVLKKRQNSSSASSSSSSVTSSSAPQATTTTTSSPIAAPTSSSSDSSAATVTGTTVTASGAPVATTTSLVNTIIPMATGTNVPPLANISIGMPTMASTGASTTYTVGATGPISGAPPLPTPFVFKLGDWPAQDKVPPTDSPEVAIWLQELEGFNIPDFSPTVNGSCALDPTSASQAATRGWWTCGGYTRDTDITACPDPMTWGVSFDDGPSPYTGYLLDYLSEKDILATFFVVGSRVIERPNVLIDEYMSGHEISVHTWSHRPLTSLTTEQIVAELGWTRKAIKTVLGVTPTTMRPPYGDIDDRVRAISLAMGMVPIMWTRTPSGGVFDTNDWKVAGGLVSAPDSFNTFETILTNATQLETGFIVLQHDLFEITVDLAVGYTLQTALSHVPAFDLQPIGECQGMPKTDLYLESTHNTTFPYTNYTAGGIDPTANGTVTQSKAQQSAAAAVKSASGSTTIPIPILSTLSLVGSVTILCSLL